MCGGGGKGGGSAQPAKPPAPRAATPIGSPVSAAGGGGAAQVAEATNENSVSSRANERYMNARGKRPFRVGLDVSVANVGGSGATGLNIPRARG